MDEISLNLADPAWWFTGLFFIIFFKLLSFIISRLDQMINYYVKGCRFKRAIFIKSKRHNLASVNFHSAKSQAFFVIFILVCALYMVWYVAGPLFEIQKSSYVLFVICMIPMMVAQILWLIEEDKAKDLVNEYNKVRARSCNNLK